MSDGFTAWWVLEQQRLEREANASDTQTSRPPRKREAEAEARAKREAEAEAAAHKQAVHQERPRCWFNPHDPWFGMAGTTGASNSLTVTPTPKVEGYEITIDGCHWTVRHNGRYVRGSTARSQKEALKQARRRVAEHANKQPPTRIIITEA